MSIKYGRVITQIGIEHALRKTDINVNVHVFNVIHL